MSNNCNLLVYSILFNSSTNWFLLQILGMDRESPLVCSICNSAFGETNPATTVGWKGLQSLLKASKAKQENELHAYFEAKVKEGNLLLHGECRKRYVDLRNVNNQLQPEKKRSRSSVSKFDWKTDCLFCGEECVKVSSSKNPGRSDYCRVEILKDCQGQKLKDKILEVTKNSTDPKFSLVHHRVLNCIDLVAVEAIYHKKCYDTFPFNQSNVEEPKKRGRPADPLMHSAFNKTCEWLETLARTTTLQELQIYMQRMAGEDNICSSKWLKKCSWTDMAPNCK